MEAIVKIKKVVIKLESLFAGFPFQITIYRAVL
jgi:hypothetical protein